MTDLRTAAQQALEALQNCANGEDDVLLTRDALAALRAALAEPVQEPAGWFEGPFGEFRANQLFKHSWPAQTVAWSIPLYLAPPKRKPLTEEEIGIICASLGFAQISPVEVARAIESAHGIT